MARDEAYREAEQKIEEARRLRATKLDLSGYLILRLTELPESLGQLTQLRSLDLSGNQLTTLPESLGQLKQLQFLDLSSNQLTTLPESLSQLTQLQSLNLADNHLTALPESLSQLAQVQELNLSSNKLVAIPDWIGNLSQLKQLRLYNNQLTSLPDSLSKIDGLKILRLGDESAGGNPLQQLPNWISELHQLEELFASCCYLTSLPHSIGKLTNLRMLGLTKNNIVDLPSSLQAAPLADYFSLKDNPLNPELAEAYRQGLGAVKLYLRAGPVVAVHEAKLILVGEGEVGKTCLLRALRDEPFVEGLSSTHGIEIQQVKVTDKKSNKEITLNGWDFGGQRVYRPTHQLFFSAPAVYLVVWKPREGPQQGFVKEWIQLIKRREPSAKAIVVATHGGPQQRQPDIDRQELWDLFGKGTVVDFFFVDSKPDEYGSRKGIEDLKLTIARVAATLPEVGRSVPKSFADVRQALQARGTPYLPLDEVLNICHAHHMDDEIARLFITISHRLGHLTHYENDPALRDIVILRPDWLATAMSYVLDDEQTRKAHGLVKFSRLSQLWNDPNRPVETRYNSALHRIFLRLMERFDLSYRVAGLSRNDDADPISLIAQLVPDTTPAGKGFARAWGPDITSGDLQQTQICRIVDAQNGQSAAAEGLFYQLIVRLHKFSLGRANYNDSVHWQRGLILDDEYNGRALLRHVGNDVHITVRAPYPERFLAMLTEEVRYLVESFWEGLRCDVMVPCIEPCGRKAPGTGLYEVQKLIESKRSGRPEYPCPICNEWQNINGLLSNAPAATQPISLDTLLKQFAEVKDQLNEVNDNTRRILSQIDKQYADLIQVFTDEAKEGPRLFSLELVDRSHFNPREWTSAKFRLTLWCEHSRLPLPMINGKDGKDGVYEIELTRTWFKKAAPVLKLVTGTLSLVLPMASSGIRLALDDAAYKALEEQLNFSKDIIDASLDVSSKSAAWLDGKDSTSLEHTDALRAEGAILRELHALLKDRDPGFGGLVRVMDKQQKFLWVHSQFAKEY